VSVASVHLFLALSLPAAFLLGAVPFGVMIARSRGIDLRAVGSGNVGATNVGRAMGRRWFFAVLLLDALKALVPAGVASLLVHANTAPADRSAVTFGLWVGLGLAAVLGHVFSPFLGFKGGKGVATGLGLVLGVFPYVTYPGLVAVGVFVIAYAATRFISVGSLLAAATLPVAYLAFMAGLGWPLSNQWPVLALLVLVASLVIWRHRDNVRRLLAGTESRG